MKCPFPLPPDRRIPFGASPFYVRPSDDPRDGLAGRRDLHEDIVLLDPIEGCECVSFAQKIWLESRPIKCGWEPGPGDAVSRGIESKDPAGWPLHLHTTFDIGGNEVHIDYVAVRDWGPLRGVQEYWVFVNGVEAGRGGQYVHVPAGIRRCWPLAVPIASNLVVIRDFIDRTSVSKSFSGVSLWESFDRHSLHRHIYDFADKGDPSLERLRAMLTLRFPKELLSKDVEPELRCSEVVSSLLSDLKDTVVDDRGLRTLIKRWVWRNSHYFEGGQKNTWSAEELTAWPDRVVGLILEAFR
jgi:hypothetical protein